MNDLYIYCAPGNTSLPRSLPRSAICVYCAWRIYSSVLLLVWSEFSVHFLSYFYLTLTWPHHLLAHAFIRGVNETKINKSAVCFTIKRYGDVRLLFVSFDIWSAWSIGGKYDSCLGVPLSLSPCMCFKCYFTQQRQKNEKLYLYSYLNLIVTSGTYLDG